MAADQDKLQATVAEKKMCYLCSDYKPQHDFKRVLADNSYSEFKHLKRPRPETESSSGEDNLNWHPYKGEITELMDNPNVEFLEFLYGCEKPSTEMGVDYVWVETEEQLRDLVEVLNKERVFAVDTEQQSLRSFLGFTSLLQISTLSEDYLVDAIKLHDVMGLLKPVFADPGICKVFHGANNDVLWLQRDFHIYVVNLFDTKKACDVLVKEEKSLAYLLKTYCGVHKNKLLQTEDWRQRPMTEEMIRYARADAHYLLYITYCLCLELKKKQLKIDSKGKSATENLSHGYEFHFLLEASRLSNKTCLRPFVKRIEKIISPSDCNAKELVRQLCLWRDVMARLHDESPGFVLSEKAINALAAEIPKTEADISSCISKADLDVESTSLVPLQSPSAIVCSHLKDLLCLLQDNIASLDNSIFQMLIQQHLGPVGSCPRSAYNEALLSIEPTDIIMSNHNGSSASEQAAKKLASRELSDKNNSRKAPVYDEYEVYLRCGQFLGYCDLDTLHNHLVMEYACIRSVDEEDGIISITLLYEPERNIPENYAIRSKKNKCVGCGDEKQYMQYGIIPSCYRIYFPLHLKSGLTHDIVLVCGNCQRKAHAAAEKYKKKVAGKFNIHLPVHHKPQNKPASSALPVVSSEEVRAAATALQCQGEKLPSDRYEKFMQVLKTYYGRSEITDEDLTKARLVGLGPRKRGKVQRKKHFKLLKENSIGGETSASIENALKGEDLSNEITSSLDDSNIYVKNDKPLQGHGPHGEQVVKHLVEYEVYTRSGQFLCYFDRDTLHNHLAMDYASIFFEDEKGIPSIILHYEPEENSKNYGKQVHAAAEKYKKKVADKFRTPSLVCHEPQNTLASSSLHKEVRAAATALQCQGEKLPMDRFQKFMKVLMTHYGCREITNVDLKNAELVGLNTRARRRAEWKKRFKLAKENNIGGETSASIENALKNDKSLQGHGPHGEQVVKRLMETHGDDGIRKFRQEWRDVFIAAVRPLFPPDSWKDNC